MRNEKSNFINSKGMHKDTFQIRFQIYRWRPIPTFDKEKDCGNECAELVSSYEMKIPY